MLGPMRRIGGKNQEKKLGILVTVLVLVPLASLVLPRRSVGSSESESLI